MSCQASLRSLFTLLLLISAAGCGDDAGGPDGGSAVDAFRPAEDAFVEPGADAFSPPDDAFSPPDDASVPPSPDTGAAMTTVSRRTDVEPILEMNCNMRGCHMDAAQFLSLTAMTGCAMASERRMVVPGSPDTSYLIAKLEGTRVCGMRMPLGRAPLSPGQVGTIRTWIAEGAQDN
jgi:hypothetical protein